LPFLALSLLRGPEVEKLLRETRELLGDRPWGVGILGFVPVELRDEQLAVVREVAPPFALIAGGRPALARDLDADGIDTYLHVPSPGLLSLFLKDGARRFVFEGRECGGHVGPRTSFVLWDRAVSTLLDGIPRDANPADYSVLLAGGIHDARSAAMAAAVTAPLVARGVMVGALCGTAYLFTDEAVETGAITEQFRQAALDCNTTTLLESGPGHATRCVPSPFTDDFRATRRDLVREGVPHEEVRERLEALNLGRLRVAAKGVDRASSPGGDAGSEMAAEVDATRVLVPVPSDQRWSRGMFMIGQIAALRSGRCTVAELHEGISAGSEQIVSALPHVTQVLEPSPPPADVAIVGMSCILPDAPDLETFWANVLAKHDAVIEVPANRWEWQRYFVPDRNTRDRIYSRWGGFVSDVPFDPLTHGMPPASLSSIEPFQLLGLLTARSALDDSGYLKRPFDRERAGVIFGAGGGGGDLGVGYTVRSSLPQLFGEDAAEVAARLDDQLPEWTEDSFAGLLMNVVAGRIANRLDLGGPNFTVDAACASSLAAVSLAVRDLQSGIADMVIAGGVDAIQNPFAYLCFSKTQALSPTGRCRPFDAEGDGIAISEGFVAVVLKRLEDAERDGDRIYAVIKGVGAGSDGRDRSLTAPRPEGQMRALRRAYAHAGVSPATVSLVEAHGTGTVAGDRAEVTSLSTVFGEAGADRQACAIGSIKSMIGHTKAAAGVAGLMKTALALHHRVLPPTLGVKTPNPKADFPNSPFYVNSEARPWLRRLSVGAADGAVTATPLRAGVSAFGFGGTNFHVVLEEYAGSLLPDPVSPLSTWPAELLVFRAATTEALGDLVTDVARQIDEGAEPKLVDLAAALTRTAAATGTEAPTAAVVASSVAELREKLRTVLEAMASGVARRHGPDGVHVVLEPKPAGKVAFLFPGQGSQYVDMGREVALAFPAVRRTFEQADRLLAGGLDKLLSGYLFPPPAFVKEDRDEQQRALTETNVAQPALGAAGLAYHRLLREFGVVPHMTAGHSYGEFVALAAAGVLTDEDMLRISAARGRFIREEAAGDLGTMAGINAAPEDLVELLADPDVHLANLNSPQQTVIAGGQAAIDRALAWCRDAKIGAKQLPVACAFHSPFVAPAQQRLAALLAQTPLAAPRIPVFSNTTAAPHSEQPSELASVLGEHLVRPVQFVRQIEAMYEAGARVFVEVGPKTVLSGLVGAILGERPHVRAAVDAAGKHGHVQFLDCLATLLTEAVAVRLDQLVDGRSRRRLDVRALAAGRPQLSPATWMVNGGRARPAAAAVPMPLPPRPASPAGTAVSATAQRSAPSTAQSSVSPSVPGPSTPFVPEVTVNGHPTANGSAPPLVATAAENGHAAPTPWEVSGQLPAPAPLPPAALAPAPLAEAAPTGAAGTSAAAEVMYRYQDVMQLFLDSQRAVMLAFLGTPEAGRSAGGGVASARPARPITALRQPIQQPQPTPVALPQSVSPPTAPPVVQLPPDPVAIAVPQQPVAPPSPPPTAPPPPPPVAAPAAVPATAAPTALTEAEISRTVLEVVSGRTGYPEDMLSLDADMEADLGIDSIKRVEIAGLVFESLPTPDDFTPELETLTTSKTLRQVIDAVVSMLGDGAAAARPFDLEPTENGRVGRLLLNVTAAPAIPAPAASDFPAGKVLVVESPGHPDPDKTNADGLGPAVVEQLRTLGVSFQYVRVPPDALDRTADSAALRLLEDPDPQAPIAGLIYLTDAGHESERGAVPREMTGLFLLSKQLRSALGQRGSGPQPFVLCATHLGGDFGLSGDISIRHAMSGSVHGFVKTLAHEWTDVRVRVVDLPDAPVATRAAQLLAEAAATDEFVEVGYRRDGQRVATALTTSPLEGRDLAVPRELTDESVVLLTGGARGITAEIAAELAEHAQPRLVLVGRTPLAVEEDPSTAGIDGMAELKRALIERTRSRGDQVTTAGIERTYRSLLAEREVRATLDRLQGLGAIVDYRTCDVSDADTFGMLIDQVYATYGRIDGVVHGAGAIEDKLVEDKDPVSFARVVATKVVPAQVLVERLRSESLQFLVFFSSVSARFGNRGQGDYAAANEALNKLANVLDRSWPARVVAMNWGPWRSTGMVSPEVLQQFEARGVTLIPVQAGRRAFLDEVRYGVKGESEVTIGGAVGMEFADLVPADARETAAATAPVRTDLPLLADGDLTRMEDGSVRLVRRFHPTADAFLDDHRIDDAAVLPFAVAMEVMAETALASAAPGETLRALREVRLFAGVTLAEDGTTLEILATPQGSARPDGTRTVSVSIKAAGHSRDHYRALVDLSAIAAVVAPIDRVPLPQQAPVAVSLAPEEAPTAQSIYRDHLFHGPAFQGVRDLTMEPTGAHSLLQPSRPQDCLLTQPSGDWLVDPVVVDSGLQLQLVWSRLHWGLTPLPLEIAELTVTTSPTPRLGLLRHEMRIRADSARPMCRADHVFRDESGAVLLTISGMAGAGSAALNRIAGQEGTVARP
jgi:acyl transferase domain-containing protein